MWRKQGKQRRRVGAAKRRRIGKWRIGSACDRLERVQTRERIARGLYYVNSSTGFESSTRKRRENSGEQCVHSNRCCPGKKIPTRQAWVWDARLVRQDL